MQYIKLNPSHPGTVPAHPFRLLLKSSAILALVLLWNLSAFAQGPSQTNGYFTAMLRTVCTDAPSNPPPVGAIRMGPGYVMMTVGVGDPSNLALAQQLATDAVFESLMPFYCALFSTNVCFTNLVQWQVELFDAAGRPHISAGAASGSQFHFIDNPPCSVNPPEQIQFLMTWVSVDVAAGILDSSDGELLVTLLEDALKRTSNGNWHATANKLRPFIREVNQLVQTGKLPATAAQTLIDGASGATIE